MNHEGEEHPYMRAHDMQRGRANQPGKRTQETLTRPCASRPIDEVERIMALSALLTMILGALASAFGLGSNIKSSSPTSAIQEDSVNTQMDDQEENVVAPDNDVEDENDHTDDTSDLDHGHDGTDHEGDSTTDSMMDMDQEDPDMDMDMDWKT